VYSGRSDSRILFGLSWVKYAHLAPEREQMG